MSHVAVHARRQTAAATEDRIVRTRRWTIGVLAASTALLLAYFGFLLATVWLFASALAEAFGWEAGSVDVLLVARDVAPVLLVGWCTGLAASAALTRGDGLGARTAGVLAGTTGAAAGAAVMALTDFL